MLNVKTCSIEVTIYDNEMIQKKVHATLSHVWPTICSKDSIMSFISSIPQARSHMVNCILTIDNPVAEDRVEICL